MPAYYKTMPITYTKDMPAEVPNSLDKMSTARRCIGINNFNMAGFVLPLWSDYSLLMHPNGNISSVGAGQSKTEVHSPNQGRGLLDDYHVVKLISPWAIRCNQDVKFMFAPNFYAEHSTDWTISPAIVDYYNQTTSNIFVFVPKKQEPKEIFLNAGMLLIRIVPLTERKVNFKIEVVDDLSKVVVRPPDFFFSNTIYKLMRRRKDNEKRCPFGGDK